MDHTWQYSELTPGSVLLILAVLGWGTHGMLGIKLKSTVCKASTLATIHRAIPHKASPAHFNLTYTSMDCGCKGGF